jgi:DNA-binding NarL/FixJ family response regulator
MAAKIQTLVVDADTLLRDGLCALLNQQEELQVIGATHGPTIARISLPVIPDLVVVETAIMTASGVEAITAIHARWPRARILVLTYRRDDQALESALRAGVDAYLLKSDSRSELTNALRSIKEGKRYVSPTIFDRVVHGYVRKHALARQHESDGLSDREREVMKRIALGHRTREIAHELSLSHKTIEKYRSNLMRKLGLKSAAAVAAYAIAKGYLDVGPALPEGSGESEEIPGGGENHSPKREMRRYDR